jgi:hypothetical protein
LLKDILKNINKNLLLLRDKQKIKRQRKRLSYLNNYKLSSTIKCAQCNFNNLTNFSRNKYDNCDKQSCTNINLRNCKKN